MISCSNLRARARVTLGGPFRTNWLTMVVASVVLSVITSAASAAIFGFILIGPLTVGLYALLLRMVRSGGQEFDDLSPVFSGFSRGVLYHILTPILVGIFTFLWSLLLVIPGIIKAISYSMSYYIRIDHPEYTPLQTITASRRLMQGHKMEYFLLQLSFIGWLLLGTLCCGVGLLWVNAYKQAANAHFYEQLRMEQEGYYA